MGTKPNIKILVCCHKPCEVPNDDVFMPIQVGKAISDIDLGFQGDDTGDNISAKNKSYCELTAMYWAWKNLKGVDYIGFCHYRRYFDFISKKKRDFNYISENTFVISKNILDINYNTIYKYDLIVGVKTSYFYNLFTQYSINYNSEDLRTLEKVIQDIYPEYDKAYKQIMIYNNKMSPCNMFICKWNLFSDYCSWLFNILETLENRINISYYNDEQKRIFGFLGERLLNVYIENKHFNKTEIPILWIYNRPKESLLHYFLRNITKDIIFKLNNSK